MTEEKLNVFSSTDKDECQKRIDTLIENLKNRSYAHSKGLITTEEMNVMVFGIITKEVYEMMGLSKDFEEGKEITIRNVPIKEGS